MGPTRDGAGGLGRALLATAPDAPGVRRSISGFVDDWTLAEAAVENRELAASLPDTPQRPVVALARWAAGITDRPPTPDRPVTAVPANLAGLLGRRAATEPGFATDLVSEGLLGRDGRHSVIVAALCCDQLTRESAEVLTDAFRYTGTHQAGLTFPELAPAALEAFASKPVYAALSWRLVGCRTPGVASGALRQALRRAETLDAPALARLCAAAVNNPELGTEDLEAIWNLTSQDGSWGTCCQMLLARRLNRAEPSADNLNGRAAQLHDWIHNKTSRLNPDPSMTAACLAAAARPEDTWKILTCVTRDPYKLVGAVLALGCVDADSIARSVTARADTRQAVQVVDTLITAGAHVGAATLAQLTPEALTALADNHPPTAQAVAGHVAEQLGGDTRAWALFAGLFAGWQSSLADLLDAARLLHNT